jgi:predicted ribosomally synthesized peptide with nif11-like leader
MSTESVKAFFTKVTSTPEYVQRGKEIGTTDLAKVVAFGKELGFDFTESDLKEFYMESIPDSTELSDEDLAAAAGGAITVTAVVASASAVVAAGAAVTSTTAGAGW